MNEPYMTGEAIRYLLPEIILVAVATCTYVCGAFGPRRGVYGTLAIAGLLLAGAVLLFDASRTSVALESPAGLFSGPILADHFSWVLRSVVLATAILFVLMAWRSGPDALATEYLGSLLLIFAGWMLVCGAGDLVLLFLGLELISIPTYVLLYLGRRDAASQEAATKYFFLSLLSSSLLLYGLTFLYGTAGSTSLVEIHRVLVAAQAESNPLVSFTPLGIVLILAGIGFKMAVVPFHFYAPDVYQGTTSTNAGLLAVVPKAAGMVVLVRLLVVAMPGIEPIGWQLMLTVAVVTMTLGNVVALWQENLRRLLAYSSIAHAGYMFVGLAVACAEGAGGGGSGAIDGLGAALLYLFVYILATLGTFAALTYLGRVDREVETVDELAGLGWTRPLVGLAIAVFMFSLTGIPPLAGFCGKFLLFTGALSMDMEGVGGGVRSWFVGLAICAALNAAVSAAYYLRIVSVMYFRSPSMAIRPQGGVGAWLATMAAAVFVLAGGLFPGPLVERANSASRSAWGTFDLGGESVASDARTSDTTTAEESLAAMPRDSSFVTPTRRAGKFAIND